MTPCVGPQLGGKAVMMINTFVPCGHCDIVCLVYVSGLKYGRITMILVIIYWVLLGTLGEPDEYYLLAH